MENRSAEEHGRAGILLHSSKSSIREKLHSVGTQDDPPSVNEGQMIEKIARRRKCSCWGSLGEDAEVLPR